MKIFFCSPRGHIASSAQLYGAPARHGRNDDAATAADDGTATAAAAAAATICSHAASGEFGEVMNI